jgi:hypothetical protein
MRLSRIESKHISPNYTVGEPHLILGLRPNGWYEKTERNQFSTLSFKSTYGKRHTSQQKLA